MFWNRILIFSLFLLSLLRIKASLGIGQTVDEAHYVLYGLRPDWSYFDHPPMVGWIHYIFQKLPFHELINARLPALMMALITSWLVYEYLKSKNYSNRNICLSVLGLNLTPMFNTMSIALLPDTVLMPMTLLAVIQTEKVLRVSNFKNWVFLGLILGLSALSKYTAVVFIPALVFIFAYKNKIKEIFELKLWAGAGAAFVILTPLLYWNVQNDFVSFKYQGEHVSVIDGHIADNILKSIGVQAFSWGIGPFILSLVFLLIWTLHFKNLQDKLVSYAFSLFLFLFFAWVSISEVLLPHWMLIFIVTTLPVATADLLERYGRTQVAFLIYIPSMLISLALLAETAFKIFPADKTASLYEGVYGWDVLVDKAVDKLSAINAPRKGLAVMNWTLGSRVTYYAKNRAEVFVLDHRFDQFDIWNKTDPSGIDFVLLIEKNKKDEHLAMLNCQSLEQIGENVSTLENITVNHFLYYYCKNLIEIKR